ncbi:MAG: hypothetical protein HOP17_08925 [Acidobacteria bacterium]|nr:hypothetical protein [Acidobacteriota bacterium]
MSSPSKEHPTDDRWNRLFARKLEMETIEAFRFFRGNGIEPVLIKGWAAARNYPDDTPRTYTDIDIAVAASDHEKAKELLASERGKKIAVDLHRELRHLDTRSWTGLLADSIEVELDGYPIRVPSAEDHLRILAVHWLNDGGERKDRLWDIYYAVDRRPSDFSWDRCLGVVDEVRRQWVVAAIGLTHKYLGLNLTGLPFEKEANEVPAWLSKTVEKEWNSGVLHRSLHTSLNDPLEFFRQLRKRFPPNPLQAMIEQEGRITARSRLPYQLGSMKNRMLPSIKGLLETIRLKSR